MATKILHTADDLLALPDDGMRHELVKGELRSMTPAGSEHGVVAMNLATFVAPFVRTSRLGLVFTAETGFRIASEPDTVRAPDLAFVAGKRIPDSGIPKGFWPGAPDLAAEVVSPGDRYEEVEEKVLDWLRAGTRLVWVVNPRTRTVAVHEQHGNITLLTESETLTGGDVLPGFECRVAELFA